MTTASRAEQHKLLTLQKHDTRIAQLMHRRKNAPTVAAVAAMTAKAQGVSDRVVAARTKVADVARDVAKAEADVEQVRQRRDREQAKLDSGAVPAKSLTALQGDIEHLDRRMSDLEDTQLALLESQDDLNENLAKVEAEYVAVTEELHSAQAAADSELDSINAELAGVRSIRDTAAAGIDAGLLALYEKIREKQAGIGAAALVGRRCEGCRIDLTEGDMSAIRAAAPDQVVRCEECSRILVITDQSGVSR